MLVHFLDSKACASGIGFFTQCNLGGKTPARALLGAERLQQAHGAARIQGDAISGLDLAAFQRKVLGRADVHATGLGRYVRARACDGSDLAGTGSCIGFDLRTSLGGNGKVNPHRSRATGGDIGALGGFNVDVAGDGSNVHPSGPLDFRPHQTGIALGHDGDAAARIQRSSLRCGAGFALFLGAEVLEDVHFLFLAQQVHVHPRGVGARNRALAAGVLRRLEVQGFGTDHDVLACFHFGANQAGVFRGDGDNAAPGLVAAGDRRGFRFPFFLAAVIVGHAHTTVKLDLGTGGGFATTLGCRFGGAVVGVVLVIGGGLRLLDQAGLRMRAHRRFLGGEQSDAEFVFVLAGIGEAGIRYLFFHQPPCRLQNVAACFQLRSLVTDGSGGNAHNVAAGLERTGLVGYAARGLALTLVAHAHAHPFIRPGHCFYFGHSPHGAGTAFGTGFCGSAAGHTHKQAGRHRVGLGGLELDVLGCQVVDVGRLDGQVAPGFDIGGLEGGIVLGNDHRVTA